MNESSINLTGREKDVLKLIDLKKSKIDINSLRKEKDKFLQENYTLLCKIYGEPMTKFDFEYKDKNGDYKKIENLTPIEFKNRKFCNNRKYTYVQ